MDGLMKYFTHGTLSAAAFGTALTLLAGAAVAQDATLYAPPPPADAAAIRVMTAGGQAPAVLVGSTRFQPKPGLPSGYRHVKQGQLPVTVGAQKVARPFAAGRYYSIVTGNFGREQFRIFSDPKPSLSKATVVFYNLSSMDQVSLKTADGKITLQPNVAHGASASREVNPLRVGFAVYQGSRKLGEVPAVQLRRGATLGIFLTQAGRPQVFSAPGAAIGR
ncbi:MAG: alginate O-acetyltransferase AlgF [Sphingobium sp.]|uniref:alginate O-acetyltransferase AlgF n=1 Tax=Sphingobium sp. TaxID=1912891 RepID=UPI0029A98E41|nr:alginate O-acetyltransferase AlgF [Sphingobium sp.]MDX3909064.1 alginate O-acetyltransferase AlgF [Sphingobium sp.]